jgi:hypothetical protein
MKSRFSRFSAIMVLLLSILSYALFAFSFTAAPAITFISSTRTVSHQAAISKGGILLMSRHYPSIAYGSAGFSYSTSAPADLVDLKNWKSFSVQFRWVGFTGFTMSTPRAAMQAYVIPPWIVLISILLPSGWLIRRRRLAAARRRSAGEGTGGTESL